MKNYKGYTLVENHWFDPPEETKKDNMKSPLGTEIDSYSMFPAKEAHHKAKQKNDSIFFEALQEKREHFYCHLENAAKTGLYSTDIYLSLPSSLNTSQLEIVRDVILQDLIDAGYEVTTKKTDNLAISFLFYVRWDKPKE